ncbi:AAA family ATPase [Phytohabitans houttuyneae]|uniref:Chaperone n=1 Tax=Phytohabitans houttuyneae TaxID=1076126 RepID=A0A6V8KKH2_9ACTN|nr:AAA family ATPase [Phytohabitans houttuyneae]GFJ85692.1 chaperone [Phytohabitans houttuyneae]
MSTPPPAAPWLVRAFHELRRQRHLVLHGNIEDLVRWDDRYLPFGTALSEFLHVVGFAAVARYSLVDGLTYPEDSSREFVERQLNPPEEAPAPVPEPAAALAPSPDGRSARQERLASSAQALQQELLAARHATPRTAEDTLAAAHRLMVQREAPCAFVLDSADLVIGSTAQVSVDHIAHVAHVRRLLSEAVEVPGAQGVLRNTVVFVVRDLASLPPWIHRDNPMVAAVLADRPGIAERKVFLTERLPRYYRAAEVPPDRLDTLAANLATLTEGMSVRELIALEATSHVARLEPAAARRLVARHRFGLREDPWEQLDIAKVREADKVLSRRVIGQPAAVRAVCDVLVNARGGLDFVAEGDQSGTRPKGVFFFVGPTGVGKTELAKALAEVVFGDEAALRRFDMSEFSQEHASERLTGAPPGYVGHEQGGVLTNWVLERPFSVILFDEIEKASRKIFDKFLQIIDDGRLTDGQGRTAHFSHSIVVFTSNLGAGTLRQRISGSAMPYEAITDHFNRAVTDFFTTELGRPELLGRLGSGVVVFDILREEVIKEIIGKFLDQLAGSARARGWEIVFDRAAIDRAVIEEIMRDGAALGARQIRSPLLERWVRVPVNRWVLEHSPPPGTRLWVRRSTGASPFTVQVFPNMAEGATA